MPTRAAKPRRMMFVWSFGGAARTLPCGEGNAHHNARGFLARCLSTIVSAAAETPIFLSTRGDSLRLRAAMAAP